MSEKIYFYPVWMRIWHGLNAIFIILLIITGISMQYSDLNSPFIRFDMAVSMHNFSGVALTLNYRFLFLGNIIFGNGRYYRLKSKALVASLWKQLRYYSYGVSWVKNRPIR